MASLAPKRLRNIFEIIVRWLDAVDEGGPPHNSFSQKSSFLGGLLALDVLGWSPPSDSNEAKASLLCRIERIAQEKVTSVYEHVGAAEFRKYFDAH
jgi:hypothetical protein